MVTSNRYVFSSFFFSTIKIFGALNENQTKQKARIDFNIVFETDTIVEDIPAEHHPAEKNLTGFATYFVPLPPLRDVLQCLTFEFSPICLNKCPPLEFIQLVFIYGYSEEKNVFSMSGDNVIGTVLKLLSRSSVNLTNK